MRADAAVVQWCVALGRAEGASLLALWLVAMPLKYALGLREPVAWMGWAHGVLFLLYGVSLGSVSRVCALSWAELAQGVVASVLPFGTLWFERRLVRSQG
jgi:integral membrane protein